MLKSKLEIEDKNMKFINTIFGILFAIMLFNIFWPLLVFFGVVILIYVIYIRFKIKSAMNKQENMYQDSQDNQNSYDNTYTNTSYTNTRSNQNSSSDVIDVEYSEREVSDN